LALDLEYVSTPECQDAYDDAARTRGAIGGFTKYSSTCQRGRRNEPANRPTG